MTTFDLVLIGFGNVARRFVTLLDERREILAREYQMSARVVGIATKRHGQLSSPRGIDAIAAADRIRRGESLVHAPGKSGSSRGRSREADTVGFIRQVTKAGRAAARRQRLVVVETTTLDIARGQPAVEHVRAALSGGAHVITANKGPAAFAYGSLAEMAADAGRRFLFEGAVMDGIPLFNLTRETLPAVRTMAFRGVVNSTTNFILTAMEQGQSFERALAEMQAAGIAEADPSLDVEGWDAAAKTAALANVLLGGRLTPHQVVRQGIGTATVERAVAARGSGRRLKLVARAERSGTTIKARVGLEELPADDLLAGVVGQQNAIILTTDVLDEIAIVQRGGSLTHTAYALLADLVTIARDVIERRATSRSRPSAPVRRSL